MDYEHEDFIIDLADGYSEEALEEVREVYERAKALDEVIALMKDRHLHYLDDVLDDIDTILMDYEEG